MTLQTAGCNDKKNITDKGGMTMKRVLSMVLAGTMLVSMMPAQPCGECEQMKIGE